jgi:hypothetical protein
MTITLDDELVERAARATCPGMPPCNDCKHEAMKHITAYLQGAVDAGKAVRAYGDYHDDNSFSAASWATALPPVIILTLPSQNPSSAESSSISEQAGNDDA